MSPHSSLHTDRDPDQIMMSMPTDQALRHSEITAIRALSDSVAACVRAIQEMRVDLKDTRETVIRFEAITTSVASLVAKGDALALRVDALEADRDRRSGALGLSEWAFKYLPWLITVICAGVLTLVAKGGKL